MKEEKHNSLDETEEVIQNSSEPSSPAGITAEPEKEAEKEPEKASEELSTGTLPEEKPKKLRNILILAAAVMVFCVAGVMIVTSSLNQDNKYSKEETSEEENPIEKEEKFEPVELTLRSNNVENLDLALLRLENDGKTNIVYSPLSIKYALAMLNEGTGGESHDQIRAILGDYTSKKYTNSNNLSLANAFFVNENIKDSIKDTYTSNLQSKYNADLFYDPFTTSDNINSWVSDKTFGLVKDLVQQISPVTDHFVLINALAIDMEWNKKIGTDNLKEAYRYEPAHTNVYNYGGMMGENPNGFSESGVAATAFKYDIIKELGEEKIRNTVQEAYEEWKKDEAKTGICENEAEIAAAAPDLDEYVSTLRSHYGHLSSSTDFEFYDDENISVFAKDLKEYDGTTLQYIGIAPKTLSLTDYLSKSSASDIISVVDNLKPLVLDSFEDGVVTLVKGKIPFFDIDYKSHLVDDLKSIGIKDIFDDNIADLSGISDEKGLYIEDAIHKANISFSNDGIKAGAATAFVGGIGGSAGCNFLYNFDVPTKTIELNFSDKPFIFLVRDKDSGEIWFTGLVYDPAQ